MPKQTKAYACEFGCGRNVLTSLKRMSEHESRCFRNPARRACQTCSNFMPSSGRDYDYEQPGCDAGVEVHEQLRHDCGKWAAKSNQ